MHADVDLIVNSYERTYRSVLARGFFPGIVEQNQRPFARRIALVNNVNDRRDAEARAQSLIRFGELDAYYFVADHLDEVRLDRIIEISNWYNNFRAPQPFR